MKNVLFILATTLSLLANAQGDIYLSLPSDGEVIEDKTLNFVWQASSLGSQEDPRLSQELVVTEMLVDQSPFEALEINRPILNQSKILGSSFYVSNANFPFEEGKKYAWQIRYYMNGVLITRSEAWWFELGKPDPQPREFVPLRVKSDGRIISAYDDELYLSLTTRGDLILEASIVNEKGESNAVTFNEIKGLEQSDEKSSTQSNESRNFILAMKDMKLDKGIYILKWRPTKEASYTLLFEIL